MLNNNSTSLKPPPQLVRLKNNRSSSSQSSSQSDLTSQISDSTSLSSNSIDSQQPKIPPLPPLNQQQPQTIKPSTQNQLTINNNNQTNNYTTTTTITTAISRTTNENSYTTRILNEDNLSNSSLNDQILSNNQILDDLNQNFKIQTNTNSPNQSNKRMALIISSPPQQLASLQSSPSSSAINNSKSNSTRTSQSPNELDDNRIPSHRKTQSIEEESAQHIRNVYAHLEKVGVPGDGFSEGVERTREHRRLSTSKTSNLVNRQIDGDDDNTQHLPEPELNVLRNADRYGFFKQTSSERVIVLDPLNFYPSSGSGPSSTAQFSSQQSTSKPSSISRSLARSASNNPFKKIAAASNQHEKFSKKEASRIEKWTSMLISDQRDSGSNILSYRLRPEWSEQRDRFEDRCYKGIPDRWRRAVWEMLMIEFEEKKLGSKSVPMSRLRSQFNELLNVPSEQDIQIDLDVPRTINGHIFFHTRYGRGQRALFQVLHTFAMYCSTCGYCQGMGPIAATLLSYFDAEMAFVCMARIHDSYDYHSVFSPGFPGLLECFYIQERLIEFLIPAVHKKFEEQMISTSAYATKWYITLFANTISYESQLRLWDIFFLKGIDSLILGSVSIVYSLRFNLGQPILSSSLNSISSNNNDKDEHSGFGKSSRFDPKKVLKEREGKSSKAKKKKNSSSNNNSNDKQRERVIVDFETILSNLGGKFEIEESDRLIRSIKKLFKREEVLEIIRRSREDWKRFVEDGSSSKRVT